MIREMNNESLYIAQKTTFTGWKLIQYRIKSFCAAILYFPEHTLSTKRSVNYRTEPDQAEFSILPLLRSACFFQHKTIEPVLFA